MNNDEKITILQRVETVCANVAIGVLAFGLGFVACLRVQSCAEPIEKTTISASAEEVPQFTFNYMLNTLIFYGTTCQQTITPFSYVYDPALATPNYYGTWLFVTQTSANTSISNYPSAIVNSPYLIGDVLYPYSLGGSVLYSQNATYVTASGLASIPNAYLNMRVYTDFTDFAQIDTTSYPSITVSLKRATDAATLFPLTSRISVENIVYQTINIRFTSLDNTPLNMAMIFPMAVRSTTTAFDNATWYYSQGISENYNVGFQNGVSYADNRVNSESASYKAGEQAGFDRGVISDTDYSMKSLFLALFDAPLTIIQKGLNFEFFGVNLAGLVLSLLTLALAVFILRTFFFK